MPKFLLSLALLTVVINASSQSSLTDTSDKAAQSLPKQIVVKPVIDTSVLGKWPSAQMPAISRDGSYALYMIRNQPAEGSTLVIRSLKNGWKREIINASNALFTDDSRKVFFIDCRETLCSLDLGSESIDSVAGASSYKLIKQNGEEWLVYQLSNTAKELKAVNLKDASNKSFTGVINYLFSADGNVLLILKHLDTDNKSQAIDWINFPSGKALNIWNGNSAKNFIFDEGADQLAFVVEAKDAEKSIFYYKAGKEKAELLADYHTSGLDTNLVIDGISGGFSKDGEKLFINLKEKERPKPKPGAVMVDVWSYQDIKLQSQQLLELTEPPFYRAAIQINNHEVIRLQQEGDRNISIPKQWKDKVYVSHYVGNLGEAHWNAAARQSHYLVSTDNGDRQLLKLEPEPFLAVSPSGKYIIGKVKEDKQNIYCFNTFTGKAINITQLISAPYDEELDDKAPPGWSKWLEMGSWLENEKRVILFDRYDMWLVDPDGKKSPINVTNGFGEKNKVIFRLPEVYRNKFISAKGRIVIKAFNRLNKEEGFFSIEISKYKEDPKLLTMGRYNYEILNIAYNTDQLKSPSSQSLLVLRESASQSPNYFLTSNFKTFTPVTDVYPEKAYNWLTSELHTWKSLNGESLQGILYKPGNFDPKKKYPVIFHYYSRMSDQLNKYLAPKVITDHLNIPWFVSNGYLVFTPDIHYEIGKPGEGALSSIVSAAHYLAKFPWVDGKRMGLQGQSFGGYETNYIVTHSNLFAAAMSSAGISDLISGYGSLGWAGRSAAGYFEKGQGRIGGTLWENPDLYINGTTIFRANSVSTPLLMMSNKKDELIFPQQLEFFLALRRLGKRAWMLQYDNGSHFLSSQEDALQHTIRMTQFFNHYLKSAAAPKWMTKGIPAKMKGIDDGLELDYDITSPGSGLLNPDEKRNNNSSPYGVSNGPRINK